jgi:hypothetical protein
MGGQVSTDHNNCIGVSGNALEHVAGNRAGKTPAGMRGYTGDCGFLRFFEGAAKLLDFQNRLTPPSGIPAGRKTSGTYLHPVSPYLKKGILVPSICL